MLVAVGSHSTDDVTQYAIMMERAIRMSQVAVNRQIVDVLNMLPDLFDFKVSEFFYEAIHGFDLMQEGFQLVQRQSAGTVATGLIRVRMGFQKEACQADGHARPGELQHLGSSAA